MNNSDATATVRRLGDANEHRYVPVTTPKVTVIQRTAPNLSIYAPTELSRSYSNLYTPSTSSTASNHVTDNVNTLTERCSNEKKEMKELNEKLASYIEKVRFPRFLPPFSSFSSAVNCLSFPPFPLKLTFTVL
jgi:hypothetical protein